MPKIKKEFAVYARYDKNHTTMPIFWTPRSEGHRKRQRPDFRSFQDLEKFLAYPLTAGGQIEEMPKIPAFFLSDCRCLDAGG